MACVPNCSLCSDVYTCEECSSGTLVGGLCLTNSVSSSSGVACSDSFSFDIAEFNAINSHINSQLGVPLSTHSVSYTSAKIVYPDSTTHTITDISSFTVPNYHKSGLTSFSATLRLSLTANGQHREGDVATISLS